MKMQKMYIQENKEEIEKLIRESNTCLLVTQKDNDSPLFGIFNPLLQNHKIYLHLSRSDKQVQTLMKQGKGTLIFQDILAILPSHWVDAQYAGAATTYYRYAELHCLTKIIENPVDQIPFLENMMKVYQPEKNYQDIQYESPIYQKKLQSITVVEFTIESSQTKWKLGQNRSVQERLEVAKKFRERNKGSDLRVADEIERWIELHS